MGLSYIPLANNLTRRAIGPFPESVDENDYYI